MEVTTSNFAEARKIISSLISKAQYFSFDLEFSGLRFEKFEKDFIHLLPFEKYAKLKHVAENYQILQFGLSIVVFEESLKVYPFNIFLFPRNPASFDKQINLQLGCLKFNAEHGFDWNKWIGKGVNYIKMSEMQFKEWEQILLAFDGESKLIAIEFLKSVDRVAKSQAGKFQELPYGKYFYLYKRLTKLFYQYILQRKYNVAIQFKRTKEIDEEKIVLTKISPEEKTKSEEQNQQNVFGFTLLFQQIWESKKHIVGHNCLLDLMYTYSAFVGNLPDNYFQFKRRLNETGLTFFDTKYIANQSPQLFSIETKLQNLVTHIQKNYQDKIVKLQVPQEYKNYSLDNPSLHEAGYDSYITAWVFQQMTTIKQIENCENILNINNSFFYMNLSDSKDIINPKYMNNILRVNMEAIADKNQVKEKRTALVRKIKECFQELTYFQDYMIHEGYREIFIQMKQNKSKILAKINSLISNGTIKEINTFQAYLQWQLKRISKMESTNNYQAKNFNKNQNSPLRIGKSGSQSQSSESSKNEYKNRRVFDNK